MPVTNPEFSRRRRQYKGLGSNLLFWQFFPENSMKILKKNWMEGETRETRASLDPPMNAIDFVTVHIKISRITKFLPEQWFVRLMEDIGK